MKKIFITVLCLLMLISFTTGCGSNRTKDETKNDYVNEINNENEIKNISELTAADVKVGDYIKFGAYEQDNNTSNGKEDIEWLVLEVKDGKAAADMTKCVLCAYCSKVCPLFAIKVI